MGLKLVVYAAVVPGLLLPWRGEACGRYSRGHAVVYGVRVHSSAAQALPAYASIRQHMSGYVSIRQDTSGYVRIRQDTSAVSIRVDTLICCASSTCIDSRQVLSFFALLVLSSMALLVLGSEYQ